VKKIAYIILILVTIYHNKTHTKKNKKAQNKNTLIFGHRGASFDTPENTLTSIKKAFSLGANGVEIDVQLTHDKKIIVIHDDTLKRTATYTKKLQDMGITKKDFEHIVNTPVYLLEHNQINHINIGLWKNCSSKTLCKKELVPTLNQVLNIIFTLNTPPKKIQIEIKTDNLSIISKLKNEFLKYPKNQIAQSIILISFDLEIIKTAKREIPHCTCLLIRDHKQIPTPQDKEQIISTILDAKLDGIALEASPALVTQELVNKLHKKNKLIGVWVYPKQDTPENLHYFEKIGANFFTTNLPSNIVNIIKNCSPPSHIKTPSP